MPPPSHTNSGAAANPLHTFDKLRFTYAGPGESVRCVEIDTVAQRLYIASSANAVFVWHLTSRKPLAALQHPFWVNAIRRYPPLFPPWQLSSQTEVDLARASSSATTAGAGVDTSDHLVLTACEDGVITAWNPSTYKIADQVRPGFGAVTALHTVSPSSTNKRSRNDTLCFAASLEHVFVLQARPQLLVLQDLVHPGTCLSMHVASEPWLRPSSQPAPSTSHTIAANEAEHHAPLLVVGQEDGTIVCWSCVRGTLQWGPIFGRREVSAGVAGGTSEEDPMVYKDTLLYPAEEQDVEEDAQSSSAIQKPGINIATSQLKNTFRCNVRRLCPAEADPAPAVDGRVFARTVGLDSPAVAKPTHHAGAMAGHSEHVHYDRRRVTCLAGAPAAASTSASRFLSGHATGEVLLWDTIVGPRQYKRSLTVLLKKVHVFQSMGWVWNIMSMCLPTSWYDEGAAEHVTTKPQLPSLFKKSQTSTVGVSSEQPCSAVFAICADTGEMVYMSCDGTVRLTSGPGFVFTGGDYWCAPAADSSTRWPSVHAVFGAFDGRLEAFNVTAVVKRLRAGGRTT